LSEIVAARVLLSKKIAAGFEPAAKKRGRKT
jgi:hypothetical protein